MILTSIGSDTKQQYVYYEFTAIYVYCLRDQELFSVGFSMDGVNLLILIC